MAYTKSKNPKSSLSRRTNQTPAKKIILGVIILSALAVFLTIIYGFIATPEFLIKKEIESIVSDYYENYFYPSILTNNHIDQSTSKSSDPESPISKILQKYQESGFPRVALDQLLLSNNQKYANKVEYLEEYCNLTQSNIRIYPDPPFEKQNYHVEYSYSCKF
ncbi:hypothetical protein IKG24_01930 [Candidatus Saccharibacteria bacterium]|nr:hypothetical protein [Candidatus Saccharibacteria bacterium]